MITSDSAITIMVAALWGVCIAALIYMLGNVGSRIKLADIKTRERLPIFFRLLMPFTHIFTPFFRSKSTEKWRNTTDIQLVQAGMDQAMPPETFLALKACYLFSFPVVGLFFITLQTKPMLALGCIFVCYGIAYPTIWLKGTISRRHRSIQRALPSVLDLLTLSVEAGRDFMTALRDILQHRQKDPLTDELERVFREVQLGKQRRVALRNMAHRVKQSDLSSVVETLVQADELGVSIGHILRILGDQMRQKRFQHAEKLANESPTKLLFPLFFFIFPAVILVMLGPILLRSLSSFF